MREIKFRAWDRKAKKMFQGHEIIAPRYGFSVAPQLPNTTDINDFFVQLQRNYELMQFTGLKDRNGKEIYEGDIINETDFGGAQAIVEFFDGSFIFKARAEQSPCQDWYIKNNNIKVIGNIYENPELLTPAPPSA